MVGAPMTPVHVIAAAVVVSMVMLCFVLRMGFCTRDEERRKFAGDALPLITCLVWRVALAVGVACAGGGALAALEAIGG